MERKFNVGKLASEALSASPNTCFCPICKQTHYVKAYSIEPLAYTLECGHILAKDGNTWTIKNGRA